MIGALGMPQDGVAARAAPGGLFETGHLWFLVCLLAFYVLHETVVVAPHNA